MQVNEAHVTLKKIIATVKSTKESSIMEFVQNKIKQQNEIIEAVLEKIER